MIDARWLLCWRHHVKYARYVRVKKSDPHQDTRYRGGIEQNVHKTCELENSTHTKIPATMEASSKIYPRYMSRETQPTPDVHYDKGIKENMSKALKSRNLTHTQC